MPVEIIKCSIDDLEKAPNIYELIAEYASESSIPGLPHPAFKTATYKHLEGIGWLHAFAACVDTELVGFILVLVSVIPHYSIPIATVESFFVKDEYRRTGAGLKLRKAAEEFSRQYSPGLLITAPTGSVLAKGLAFTKEYTETNRVFFKRFT